jgi:hypothetical protein
MAARSGSRKQCYPDDEPPTVNSTAQSVILRMDRAEGNSEAFGSPIE